jgi:hypothetical protein
MAYGDHVRAWRGAFWHHAIDLGDGTVIHYTGLRGKVDAAIERSAFERFVNGCSWEVVRYGLCDSPKVVVSRAWSRLGERSYNLLWNNCESFAHWCKTGQSESAQAESAVTTTMGTAAGSVLTGVGVGVVGAIGTSAGLSGAASTMSGLATVGSAIGGGAVAGVGLLAAMPTAAGTVAMHRRFRDDPTLCDEERRALGAGRAGTVVGGGVGIGGSIGVLYGAGTVGLSAAGITSGLAAVGATVGGGMLAGAAILVGGPALVAVLIGYLAYRMNGGRG